MKTSTARKAKISEQNLTDLRWEIYQGHEELKRLACDLEAIIKQCETINRRISWMTIHLNNAYTLVK